LAAIPREELRAAAISGVLVADLAFAGLAMRTDGLNTRMRRVVVADIISILALSGAAVLETLHL